MIKFLQKYRYFYGKMFFSKILHIYVDLDKYDITYVLFKTPLLDKRQYSKSKHALNQIERTLENFSPNFLSPSVQLSRGLHGLLHRARQLRARLLLRL